MANLLERGSKSDEVRALQHQLNARRYVHLKEDGVFGANTEAAVRLFQRRVHLKADGIVGPKTRALLATRVAFVNATIRMPLKQTSSTGSGPASSSGPASGPSSAPLGGSANGSSGGFVQQVGVGGQISLTPWVVKPRPLPGTPAGPIWSGLISYAIVYRTASEGRHLEFSVSPGLLINSRVQSSDPRWSLQVTGQVTFADLVVRNRFHLISPFIQGAAVLNLGPGSSQGVSVGAGNQVSFDLIPDRLQISLQAGIAAQWNNVGTPGASFSVVGQSALGATVQF